MLSLDIIDINRNVVGKTELKEEIFDVKVKEHLIHQVVVMQMTNRRHGTSSTKTRAMVRGGGIKPWRQKGTGRARAGSIRSPLWRGGGIIFGPTPKSYNYKLPKKVRRSALKSALTQKVKEGGFLIVDKIELEEPRTKEMISILRNLKVKGRVLFILSEENSNIELSVRNIPYVNVLKFAGLNVYDLILCNTVICTEATLRGIEEVLSI
ncbi:MAG: 50S ribosomal protein L4 [Nitrospinota bacterium]